MVWALRQQLYLRWRKTIFVHAYVIQRTHEDNKKMNMALVQLSFYLVDAQAICAIFFLIEHSIVIVMALVIY